MASLLLILIGLALLFGGAEWLVRGATRLSLRLGLAPVIVGLTIVAFGTSAPEMVVGVLAAIRGEGGLVAGAAIGSNIANVGLVLGIAVVVRPMRVEPRLVRADIPLVMGASVLVAALLFDRMLGRTEGGLLVCGLLLFVLFSILMPHPSAARTEFDVALEVPTGRVLGDVLRLIGGVVALAVGAHSLVRGGTTAAAALDVPPEIIGLTVIAVGTSLPELTTSVVAALRGSGDLALGNVVGSNLFNLLGVLGVSALIQPIHAPALAFGDIVAMTAAAVVLLPLAVSHRNLSRIEGMLLLGLYIAYVVLVLVR